MIVRNFTAEDGNWDDLVSCFSYYTIFNSEFIINALGLDVDKLVIVLNNEIVAAIIIFKFNGCIMNAPIPFSPYNGLMIKDKYNSNHRRINFEVKVSDALIDYIVKEYGRYSLSFSPEFTDIRPFYWHCYNNNAILDVTVRYTAYLNLENKNFAQLLGEIRTARRQEFKKFIGRCEKIISVNDFISVYIKMYNSKGISTTIKEIKAVESICRGSINSGNGFLTGAYTLDGDLASVALFLIDKTKCYYMFGATDPDFKMIGAGTALILYNIEQLMIRGVKQVDFVGVNSPGRGDYKTSFNTSLKPYYIVSCD